MMNSLRDEREERVVNESKHNGIEHFQGALYNCFKFGYCFVALEKAVAKVTRKQK